MHCNALHLRRHPTKCLYTMSQWTGFSVGEAIIQRTLIPLLLWRWSKTSCSIWFAGYAHFSGRYMQTILREHYFEYNLFWKKFWYVVTVEFIKISIQLMFINWSLIDPISLDTCLSPFYISICAALKFYSTYRALNCIFTLYTSSSLEYSVGSLPWDIQKFINKGSFTIPAVIDRALYRNSLFQF